MINKRQRYNRSNRIKEIQDLGPRGLSLRFIKTLDQIRPSLGKSVFKLKLKKALEKLEDNIKLLDIDAKANIIWADEDTISVSYITIEWSEGYLKDNKDEVEVFMLDVAKYYLEGVLFE